MELRSLVAQQPPLVISDDRPDRESKERRKLGRQGPKSLLKPHAGDLECHRQPPWVCNLGPEVLVASLLCLATSGRLFHAQCLSVYMSVKWGQQQRPAPGLC